MNRQFGFTLVEIMVAVGLISILAAFIIPNINQGSAQSRDAERKADLRTMQGALELYKQKYGRYPTGCNIDPTADRTDPDAWRGTSNFWSGQVGTTYACPGGSAAYIEGLASEFIPVLPTDPQLNGNDSGYVYITNPDGTVYKLLALNTVEDETVGLDNEFLRCGDTSLLINECRAVDSPGNNDAGYTYNSAGATPAVCADSNEYENDYAVWGGYAEQGYDGNWKDHERAREYFSDQIRCR